MRRFMFLVQKTSQALLGSLLHSSQLLNCLNCLPSSWLGVNTAGGTEEKDILISNWGFLMYPFSQAVVALQCYTKTCVLDTCMIRHGWKKRIFSKDRRAEPRGFLSQRIQI